MSINEELERMNDSISKLGIAISEFAQNVASVFTSVANQVFKNGLDILAEYKKAEYKLNCNNWRKTHGLPMIRRARKRRNRRKIK